MKSNLLRIILFLSCSLISLTSSSQIVLADNKESVDNSQEQKISFNLPQPPSKGIPLGRHSGGGSRSSCQNYQNLTALVPINNKIVWGKTTATHPEFLFYLPQGSAIEFVLQDEADNYVYQTSQDIPQENQGIVRIPIPHTATPLETNHTYKWTLFLSCESGSTALVYVQGSIEKAVLDSSIKTQLQTASDLEKSVIYARQGIWYDAIALLARLRQDNPNDDQINRMWNELLQQVDLTAFSSQPMLN